MGLDLEEEEKKEKVASPKTRTKRTKELLEENLKKVEELSNEHESLEKEISAIDGEDKALGDKDVVGMDIEHEKFGKGKIAKQDGKYIEVQFKDVIKKFVLPGAIADGYLRIDDEELIDYFKKKNDVHNRMLKAQVALRSNEFTAERIKEEIDKLKEKA
ncbi:hypothetical protein [Butyrivibrio sp. WCD3002]|uniref:hypothetical protein n=1 Tax=Butyrivibrio sp. WCD3002 TaxID=1280676 RepID=UPI0004259052|nr:hypothetical protein [Butyrivibrio sp. WCD3002]